MGKWWCSDEQQQGSSRAAGGGGGAAQAGPINPIVKPALQKMGKGG